MAAMRLFLAIPVLLMAVHAPALGQTNISLVPSTPPVNSLDAYRTNLQQSMPARESSNVTLDRYIGALSHFGSINPWA